MPDDCPSLTRPPRLPACAHARSRSQEVVGVVSRAIALKETYAESLPELVKLANDPNNTTKPNAHALERARRQFCEYYNLFDEKSRKTRNYERVGEVYARDLRISEGRLARHHSLQNQQPLAPNRRLLGLTDSCRVYATANTWPSAFVLKRPNVVPHGGPGCVNSTITTKRSTSTSLT